MPPQLHPEPCNGGSTGLSPYYRCPEDRQCVWRVPHSSQPWEEPKPSPNLISLICLNITNVGLICIQDLSSTLPRYLLCVLGSTLVGVRLHICQKTTSSALLPLLRAVSHWLGILPDSSCASKEVPVSSASHLTGLVLQVHTTIPA